MRCLLLVVVCSLALGAPASADDATKPYDFRVILRIEPHRLLTPTFQRQLHDELQDALQAAFGPLAQVDVQDANTAWLDPATLDRHSETASAKRHFVEIAYVDGRYVIKARQHDGETGLASPVVREARTADRAFVGRLVTRFIEQDFGPVGTVVRFDKGTDRAVLALHGGALSPGDWPRRVPIGTVFAVSRVEGSPPRGRPVESAYLVTVAEPKDGRVDCRFVYRYQDQLADWSAVTYRALRLGTAAGPVRLRVVDRNGLPQSGLQVRVSADGFRPTDAVRDQGAVRAGVFDTANAYDPIAFVLITSGDLKVAQVPVPVIDDRVTLVRMTAQAAGGEARQQLELDARNAHQRLLDIRRRLSEQNSRLNGVIRSQRHQEALVDVKKGLDLLDSELGALTAEIRRLRKDAARVESSAGPVLEQCDVFVKDIRKRRESLVQSQDRLEEAIKDEKQQEPQRQSYLALLARADAQCEDADFEEAIKTLEQILQDHGELEKVRKRLTLLQEQWTIKTEEQRQARRFAYGPWAKLKTLDDVRTNLPKAREALDACKQVGDRLTALKLLNASTAATEVVVKAVEELEKGDSDSDKINLQQAVAVNAEFQAFIKDVSEFVRSEAKKP
jgi:tetratricopeptide (TPR) repeat protein